MILANSLNVALRRGQGAAAPIPDAETVRRLAAAGFDGLDFNLLDRQDGVDWGDERAAAAVLDVLERAARDAGMPWVQAHGPMFRMFSAEPTDARRRELCAPALRACGRLGVPWMVLHSDTLPGPFDGAHRREVLRRNVQFFRSLLPSCEKHGVGIALENIFDEAAQRPERGASRWFGSVPEELCELVDAVDHPLVGACWDTGHARIMRLDQRAALAALGPRLKAVHIHDNGGVRDDHVLPFQAADGVDWTAVTEGLRKARYAGAFCLEVASAFTGTPDPFWDMTARHAVAVGRELIGKIGG